MRRANLVPVARQLASYATIGLLVAAIDFTTFKLTLYEAHLSLFLATSIAYGTGVTSHFLMNRHFNFRNFERKIHQQALTYGVIVCFGWLFTVSIVGFGVRSGLHPFPARVVAIVLNFPLGFACHRYLTFGPGILAMLRRSLGRIRDRA